MDIIQQVNTLFPLLFKTCFDFDPSGYKTDYVLAKVQKKECKSLSDLQPINVLVNNLDKLMVFN